tara:strand:- start:127 stop:2367 length:2241 start_codon:yes stop_codon:yes gene_type:complete
VLVKLPRFPEPGSSEEVLDSWENEVMAFLGVREINFAGMYDEEEFVSSLREIDNSISGESLIEYTVEVDTLGLMPSEDQLFAISRDIKDEGACHRLIGLTINWDIPKLIWETKLTLKAPKIVDEGLEFMDEIPMREGRPSTKFFDLVWGSLSSLVNICEDNGMSFILPQSFVLSEQPFKLRQKYPDSNGNLQRFSKRLEIKSEGYSDRLHSFQRDLRTKRYLDSDRGWRFWKREAPNDLEFVGFYNALIGVVISDSHYDNKVHAAGLLEGYDSDLSALAVLDAIEGLPEQKRGHSYGEKLVKCLIDIGGNHCENWCENIIVGRGNNFWGFPDIWRIKVLASSYLIENLGVSYLPRLLSIIVELDDELAEAHDDYLAELRRKGGRWLKKKHTLEELKDSRSALLDLSFNLGDEDLRTCLARVLESDTQRELCSVCFDVIKGMKVINHDSKDPLVEKFLSVLEYHQDESIRWRASMALSNVRDSVEVNRALLSSLKEDNSWRVRRACIRGLTKTNPVGDVLEEFIDCVYHAMRNDDSPEVRANALGAISVLSDSMPVGFLIGVFKDDVSEEVRWRALEILDGLRHMEDVRGALILSLHSDGSEKIRKKVANILSIEGEDSDIQALVESLRLEQEISVKVHVASLLKGRDYPEIHRLMEKFARHSLSEDLRVQACEHLISFDIEEHRSIILDVLEDPEIWVGGLILSLADVGGEWAIEALEKLHDHPVKGIREYSKMATSKIRRRVSDS